jgi:S1-C subfamily serine protease
LWWFWPVRMGLNPQAQPRPVTARGSLSEEEKANMEIYVQSAQSLAQVTNQAMQQTSLFGLNVQAVPKGVGSGFVWDSDGHIVTNYHVIQGADSALVTLADHHTYQARQVRAYPDQDIAVLSIDAGRDKLHPIMIGSSHDLKVGQITYALGDPFGLDQTMTIGIVSALNRTIDSANGQPIQGVIQTSAPINPGNSGGPLLDSAGRLIGMNTAILSPSGAFAGIGFAIPVDEINRIVPELIRHGKVVRPRLGVQIAGDQLARHLDVDHGALVIKVMPNSAAATAGLKETRRDDSGHIVLGDIIVAVDGKSIDTSEDLHSAVEGHKVGDTVTLSIIRDGKPVDVKATLTEG